MSATEVHNYSTYTNNGCRCDTCRAANAEQHRKGRERRAAALQSGEVVCLHGTFSTYSNYGCRCDDCRAASAQQRRRWRQRRAGESQ